MWGGLIGHCCHPPLLSLCWSRDRTNHVLVIRLETAADQDVFLSHRGKFSSFVFISPFLLGISLFESPVSGLFGIFSSRFILIVGLGRFSLRIPRWHSVVNLCCRFHVVGYFLVIYCSSRWLFLLPQSLFSVILLLRGFVMPFGRVLITG